MEYRPLNNNELKHLWKNATFVFDTNVLLNFYRYSEPTQNEFQNALKNLNSRIWIPYQVGKEYQLRRLKVIAEQKKIYDQAIKDLEKLKRDFDHKARNPFLSSLLHDKFDSLMPKIHKELSENANKYSSLSTNDKIRDFIFCIFDGKVGKDFSENEKEEIYRIGEERYFKKVPPGYMDMSKPEPDRYGDLLIWKQILAKATKEKELIVFVTNDEKEDWWLKSGGCTIAPRPELLREFHQETKLNCYIYKPFQFLTFLNEFSDNKYNLEAIGEIEKLKPIQEEEFLKVQLIIQASNTQTRTSDFLKELDIAGFQYFNVEISSTAWKLIVILPNFPDLERRFREKYLGSLQEYGLILNDYQLIT